MNTIACIFLVVFATALAEPPRIRNSRVQFQRQELAPFGESEREQTTPRHVEAPYAAAGFKPKKEFKLPARQETGPPSTSYGTPADSYGAPLHTFSAPHSEYGAPLEQGSIVKPVVQTLQSAKPESKLNVDSLKVEGLKGETKGRLRERQRATPGDVEVISSQGAYYVLLPNAQVQRVQFQTENDVRQMAYTAKLQYRNEDRAPVYLYTAPPPASPAFVQRAPYRQFV